MSGRGPSHSRTPSADWMGHQASGELALLGEGTPTTPTRGEAGGGAGEAVHHLRSSSKGV